MISPSAWEHVTRSGIKPRQVFAHPELLQQHPEASLYYRGLSLLPQKRMRAAGAGDVKNWENKACPVSRGHAEELRYRCWKLGHSARSSLLLLLVACCASYVVGWILGAISR